MNRCPKFFTCSAPICPLDANSQARVMAASDGTCTWFLEMAKDGPQSQYVPADIRETVAAALPIITARAGLSPMRSQLKRAALTGSRRAPSRLAGLVRQAAC